MTRVLSTIIIFLGVTLAVGAAETPSENPKVVFETSKGEIVLELDLKKAPKTVKNFLTYVDAQYYDKTIFHRVIPKFMIQGGGFTSDMQKKSTKPPIKNEADNRLKNNRGTIAMARTSDPHSATAQFFINTVNNEFLNFKSKTSQGWGYAVFGKVIKGMDVVDAISAAKTTSRGPYRDVPVEPIIIKSVRRMKQ